MATRFRLTNDDTDPSVTPAQQSYTHARTGTPQYRQLKLVDTSALATTAYTPDGADDITAGDSVHSSYVSDAMPAGVTFTSGATIKMAIQGLEPNTSCNQNLQVWIGIYDSAGTTLQRTLRSKAAHATEFATALTNRFFTTTQSGATYTTASGDRLVVEIGCVGTPVAAGGVQGHNCSLRFGGNGAGGDLPENDTETGTTFNPWIEFASTIFTQTVTSSSALDATPDFPTASVKFQLVGVLLESVPDFPTGTLRSRILASALDATPDLPTALLRNRLFASILDADPTLFVGSIDAQNSVEGQLLDTVPDQPQGALSLAVLGEVLDVAPDAPPGSMRADVFGVDLTVEPDFPVGELTGGLFFTWPQETTTSWPQTSN